MNITCCQVKLGTGVEDSTVHNSVKEKILEAIIAEITSFKARQFLELGQANGHWEMRLNL